MPLTTTINTMTTIPGTRARNSKSYILSKNKTRLFDAHRREPIIKKTSLLVVRSTPIDADEMISTLRAEVDARAAAMNNLQAQLEQVEMIRAQELSASVDRFNELDSALSLAEGTIASLQERVSDMEEENRSLKEIVITEMEAAEELLSKAEELANAAAQKWGLQTGNGITEDDAEALLDELELLRVEVGAAEEEASNLKKQLLDNRDLAEQLAVARAAAAAAAAEARRLEVELREAREEGGRARMVEPMMMMMGGGNGARKSGGSAVAELEAEKAALEAQLEEGRAFLEAVLKGQGLV